MSGTLRCATPAHDPRRQRGELVDLVVGDLEDQLVVHRQQHRGIEPARLERRRHLDHRPLDDVGGRALQRRVDGRALGEAALGVVLVVDAGKVAAAAENGLDIAVAAAELPGPFHVVADAGIALEIGRDVALRLAPLNAELAGQPKGADAVDDAEVDRLGAAPDGRVHALDRHAEHLARRHRVDVGTIRERLA